MEAGRGNLTATTRTKIAQSVEHVRAFAHDGHSVKPQNGHLGGCSTVTNHRAHLEHWWRSGGDHAHGKPLVTDCATVSATTWGVRTEAVILSGAASVRSVPIWLPAFGAVAPSPVPPSSPRT